MTNIKDIHKYSKRINADHNCLFLYRALNRNKGKTQKSAKDYACEKFTETRTLRRISAQKSTLLISGHFFLSDKQTKLKATVGLHV